MKTKILSWLAAIALVFAFAFTACDNGTGGRGPGGQTGGGNQGDQTGTQRQLAFELINNGTAYRVRKGTVNSGNAVIPAYWNGTTGRAARAAGDDLPVTEIGKADDKEGNGAFEGTDITDITIPETVELIGSNAFRHNRRLTRLVIPEGVKVIGDEALYGCYNITSITIPASVTEIYSGVFSNNKRLTDIKVDPDNPNYRGEGGILYTNIEGFYVDGIHYTDDKEKTILHSYPSAKDNVTIPEGVTYIGDYAFFSSDTTSVAIPGTVTEIGYWAFSHCTSLTSIEIPEGVKLINQEAFAYCTNLTSVTLPASMIGSTLIGSLFTGCTSLSDINVAADSLYYTGKNGMLFNKNPDYLALYAYPSAKGNVTNLPTNLEGIDNFVFENNTNITGITIPNDLEYIGNRAFGDCTSITTITIPASVTYICSGAFEGWTSSQTINIQGKADRAATIAAGWPEDWDRGFHTNEKIKAKIVYEP